VITLSDLATGMLTADEAVPFQAAAAGKAALLDAAVKNPKLWQADYLGNFLIDTLAGKPVMLHAGRDYDANLSDWADFKMFVVLVVNATGQPLPCTAQAITYGVVCARPTGPAIDPVTGKLGPVTDTVPAAEEGRPGFAAWVVGRNTWYTDTNFGLAFDAVPFAVGCMGGSGAGGPNRVSLLTKADAAQAQVDAFNGTNSGAQLSATSGSVKIDAALLTPDDTSVFLALVSVTPA
jgi:hypothetical protein